MSFTKEEFQLPVDKWKKLLRTRGLKQKDLSKEVKNLRRKNLNCLSARKSAIKKKNEIKTSEKTILYLKQEIEKYKIIRDKLMFENTMLQIELNNEFLKNINQKSLID